MRIEGVDGVVWRRSLGRLIFDGRWFWSLIGVVVLAAWFIQVLSWESVSDAIEREDRVGG